MMLGGSILSSISLVFILRRRKSCGVYHDEHVLTWIVLCPAITHVGSDRYGDLFQERLHAVYRQVSERRTYQLRNRKDLAL
jgi:hypothetical protein